MKIIVKKAGMPYTVEERDKLELDDMQELVGGLIEHVGFGDNDVDLWCNDEGKLLNLPYNILLRDGDEILDVIQGDIFFAGHGDEGETLGLTDHQIDSIERRFGVMGIIGDQSGVYLVQDFAFGSGGA